MLTSVWTRTHAHVIHAVSVTFQSSVVPLSKLLVREKGDTRDSKGIYLICQSKTEPEMYEFICRSAEERKTWIKVIRSAVLKCMEGTCL